MKDTVKPLLYLLGQFSGRIEKRQVFTDFLWLSACRISNLFDPVHREQRTEEAGKISSRYTETERVLFEEMLIQLSKSIPACVNTGNFQDILGRVFEELKFGNKRLGQDLTPPGIAQLIAKIAMKDESGESRIINDPSVGGGMLILSYAEEMMRAGRNYSYEMAVMAQDIDFRCVLMSYIQFSLYGIPAVVLRADTLLGKEYDRWYTPMYIIGDWVWRQPFGIVDGRNRDDELLKIAGLPMYGIIRYPELFLGNQEKNQKGGAKCD